MKLASSRLRFVDPLDAIEYFYRENLTDGFPVIPPTESRVSSFLVAAGLQAGDIVGSIPERDREIPAEKVAINAIMAGCLPEYAPVVVASVRAVCAPAFRFNHLASLGSPWPALIVNGPVVSQFGLNTGMYITGPGCRPNATIGRALSLLLWNCAEARPEGIQRGQWGHPGRWSTCLAENEDSPWEPLHVQLGHSRETSTVTVVSTYPGLYQVWAARSQPELMLNSVCDAISTYEFFRGTYILLVPPHLASLFSRQGWDKSRVTAYLVENCKRSVAELKRRGRWGAMTPDFPGFSAANQEPNPGDADKYAYVFKPGEYDTYLFEPGMLSRRATVYVVVCGGNAGPRMAFLTPYGASTEPVTQAV